MTIGYIIDIQFDPGTHRLHDILWETLGEVQKYLSFDSSFAVNEVKNAIEKTFTLDKTFNGPLLLLIKQMHNIMKDSYDNDKFEDLVESHREFLRASNYFPPSLLRLKQMREELYIPYKYIDSMIINETVKHRKDIIMGFEEYATGKMTFIVDGRTRHGSDEDPSRLKIVDDREESNTSENSNIRVCALACLSALRELGIDTKAVKSIDIMDVPIDVCEACSQFLPLERDEMRIMKISRDEEHIFRFAEKYKKRHHLLLSLYKENIHCIGKREEGKEVRSGVREMDKLSEKDDGAPITSHSTSNKRKFESTQTCDNNPPKVQKYQIMDEGEEEEEEGEEEEYDDDDEDYESEEEEEEEEEDLIILEDHTSTNDMDYIEGESESESESDEDEEEEEEDENLGTAKDAESDFPSSEEELSDESNDYDFHAECAVHPLPLNCLDCPSPSLSFVTELARLLEQYFPDIPSVDRMNYSICIWRDMSDMKDE